MKFINNRNEIYKHFLKLLEGLGYKEEKDRIIINNSFKELDCWINEMYKKINYLDHKDGYQLFNLLFSFIIPIEIFFPP